MNAEPAVAVSRKRKHTSSNISKKIIKIDRRKSNFVNRVICHICDSRQAYERVEISNMISHRCRIGTEKYRGQEG